MAEWTGDGDDEPLPLIEIPEELGPPLAEISLPDEGSIYQRREKTRSVLALGVFFLLVTVVLTILLAVVLGYRSWAELKDVSAFLLPPVVTVVGTVLGFYFGVEKGSR